MNVGDRVVVVKGDRSGCGNSLIGEVGTVVRKAHPEWSWGCDVIVNLDSGLNDLAFESERELKLLKEED